MSSRIENYLGFPMGLSGGESGAACSDAAQRFFGVEIPVARQGSDRASARKALTGSSSLAGRQRTFLLRVDDRQLACSGRRLDAPGIDRLQGAGILLWRGGPRKRCPAKEKSTYVVGWRKFRRARPAMNFSKYAGNVW